MFLSRWFLINVAAVVTALCSCVFAGDVRPILPTEDELLGVRPYKMVNIGRNTDARPSLIDFENLDGWVVEATASEAEFRKSRRQQLWGNYVGHLKYRDTKIGSTAPFVVIRPTEPMPIVKPPPVVGKAIDAFLAPHFKNQPQRDHLANYLTGLMICPNKTITGMTSEFPNASDQSFDSGT